MSPRLHDSPQRGNGQLWQQNHTAIRVDEELDPISWFKPEVLSHSLGDGRLALAGDGGFHERALHSVASNTPTTAPIQTLQLQDRR
jgi:hypothetical protein